MSSSKPKKKSNKSTKLPVPIKIKKEDDHLIQPMEKYVDDRVELIRQIFASLKPKTITNLAPEFLKKSKLEDIQEQCLNEILGISKKRLLSIINATKCPTDTETSSEDDVNAVTEHISLEEISSDSDVAGSKVPKNTGKKKRKVKNEPAEDSTKQFSVLELLELQARARAIRSQLALEPVTKIEVGTDSEEDGPPQPKPPSAAQAASRKKPNKPANGKSDAAKKPEPSTLTVILPNGDPAPSKRIKLKRNFRKQNVDEGTSKDDETNVSGNKTPEKVVPKAEARSPSPDVIPVVAVPETLCISDSDEAEKQDKQSSSETQNKDDPVKSTQRVEILSVVNIEPLPRGKETTDETAKCKSPLQETKPPESEEEGEIVENEVDPQESNTKDKEPSPKNDEKNDNTTENKESVNAANTEVQIIEEEKNLDKSNDNQQKIEVAESDDDDNDDVISLEGGDLVDEMKEHMEDDVEEVTKHEDVICLDDSSEDEALARKKAESWNDRWLNSRKVSRVLATSRLGNKVRNKIKETKKAKKLEEALKNEKEQQEKPQQQVIFVSKHELGSVEQYKELLESIPKKSTD